MLKKRVKENSISKILCVLTCEESQDIFGIFSNNKMEEEYKTRVMRAELRGIDFEPTNKTFYINHDTLSILEDQIKQFSSVFYLFRDVYENMEKICLPRTFSTPYFVEELKYPADEYLIVLNDTNENQYNLSNYQDFIYTYPKNILKVNDCILRSKLSKAIDMVDLKRNGLIRENFNSDIFNECLEETLEGRLSNKYFLCASEAHKNFVTIKNRVEGEDYINKKLEAYESEYYILKNLRIKGDFFNREDFTIDRLIISDSGIYVSSLINWDDNAVLNISADNQWSISKDSKSCPISNKTEENILNCIAIKQLLREIFDDDVLSHLPIYPLMIVANDEKEFVNESKNMVIRGNELYLTISKNRTTLSFEQKQSIANTLLKYKLEPETVTLPIYLQDLDSIKSVYEDLYYNHINLYLPQFVELLWKVKKDDYYKGQIKMKKVSSWIMGLSAILVFIGVITNCILYKSFIDKYTVLFLYNCLILVLASASYFDYQFLQSWREGEKTGDCFEVKRSVFAFGGLFSLFAVSGIFTFLLTTLQNII